MAKAANYEYTIKPDEYRTLLKGVQLEDVALEECSTKVKRDKLDRSVKVSVSDKVLCEQGENAIVVDHAYELIAGSGAKKDFALKVTCTFRLRYSSKATLSDSFIEIFKERNVPLNTWPYFRELVQSMTQRMNIPPLTLPLLR